MADPPGVIVVTGTMAAGKSTVADLLARRFDRAVHVRGDVFRRFVVSGRVDPTPEMPPEAWQQLLLRYRLGAAAADAYVQAGFTAVWQDVMIGPVLADAVRLVSTRPVHVVVLDPDAAAVERRERGRGKSGYQGGWSATRSVADLRRGTPRLGLWVDSSDQTPEQSVQAILDHLDEARVQLSR